MEELTFYKKIPTGDFVKIGKFPVPIGKIEWSLQFIREPQVQTSPVGTTTFPSFINHMKFIRRRSIIGDFFIEI